jgi:hypothetical protein
MSKERRGGDRQITGECSFNVFDNCEGVRENFAFSTGAGRGGIGRDLCIMSPSETSWMGAARDRGRGGRIGCRGAGSGGGRRMLEQIQ